MDEGTRRKVFGRRVGPVGVRDVPTGPTRRLPGYRPCIKLHVVTPRRPRGAMTWASGCAADPHGT